MKMRTREYFNPEDICSVCGKGGKEHFSFRGKSWCYPSSSRHMYAQHLFPKYHTRFTYAKKSETGNPNTTFKKAANSSRHNV